MKPIYKIKDIVEIDNTSKKVTILDYEIFDNLILYYTDDKKAYPECKLNQIGYNSLCQLLTMSAEEKNKQFDDICKKFKIL